MNGNAHGVIWELEWKWEVLHENGRECELTGVVWQNSRTTQYEVCVDSIVSQAAATLGGIARSSDCGIASQSLPPSLFYK